MSRGMWQDIYVSTRYVMFGSVSILKQFFWTQVPIPWVYIMDVYPYNSKIKFIYFLDRVDLSWSNLQSSKTITF